jgi:hypothetical protein
LSAAGPPGLGAAGGGGQRGLALRTRWEGHHFSLNEINFLHSEKKNAHHVLLFFTTEIKTSYCENKILSN